MTTTETAVAEQPVTLPAALAEPERRCRKRRGRRRLTWARSAMLSLLAHAGLVGAASIVPVGERMQEAITIDIVQPQAEAPVPSPVEAPVAAPARVATVRVPRRPLARSVAPRPPRRAAAPPPATTPAASPPPAPAEPAPIAEPSPPSTSSSALVASAAAGGPGMLAAAGGSGTPGIGPGIASGSTSASGWTGHGFENLRGYLERVQARVARGQRYPQLAARLGLDGVVVVRVRVHPDGSFAGAPAVATSSSHEVLDREAVRMVAQAAPFPPLPAGSAAATELRVPVRFRLEE